MSPERDPEGPNTVRPLYDAQAGGVRPGLGEDHQPVGRIEPDGSPD